MATSRPDVRVYLTPSNFEALQAYCQENGVKSQSAAIDRILTAFFAVGGDTPAADAPSDGLADEVADLRCRLEAIEEVLKSRKFI